MMIENLSKESITSALEFKKTDKEIALAWTKTLARGIDLAFIGTIVVCCTCVICAIL